MWFVQPLTAVDLRRSRLHLFWLRAGMTVVVLAAIAWDLAQPTPASSQLANRAPLGSVEYATSSLQVTVLVLLVTVWIAPRLTLLWMVPVAWLLPHTGVGLPTLWRVL